MGIESKTNTLCWVSAGFTASKKYDSPDFANFLFDWSAKSSALLKIALERCLDNYQMLDYIRYNFHKTRQGFEFVFFNCAKDGVMKRFRGLNPFRNKF